MFLVFFTLVCVFFLCSACSKCLSLSFCLFCFPFWQVFLCPLSDFHSFIVLFSSFYLVFSHHATSSFPVLFLLTLSSLPSWLGVTCLSLLSASPSPSPSLLLHSSFSVYFSGEYTAGRTSLLLSHSARLLTHAVDC